MSIFGDDLDEENGTLSVTQKLDLGFEPKNYEERTRPIYGWLVQRLLAHKAAHPAQHLIFPTRAWVRAGHL